MIPTSATSQILNKEMKGHFWERWVQQNNAKTHKTTTTTTTTTSVTLHFF